jgi:hypothetical protein
MRSVINTPFELLLMLLFFKKIQNTKKKWKIKMNKGIKYKKKEVEGPNYFFGLLGHQVCLETKQLKIKILFCL